MTNEQIPKIIHFFHDADIDIFKKNKHALFRSCYFSWKKYCPDYKIMHWHDQLPEVQEIINNVEFVKKAYKCKCWAFVADYVRLYALQKYGGIYLDTDVQLLKNFDDFLNDGLFTSIEGDIIAGENITEPAILGAIPNHKIINQMISYYNKKHINQYDIINIVMKNILKQYCNFVRIPYAPSTDLKKLKMYYNNSKYIKQIEDFETYKNQLIYRNEKYNLSIYPSEYFCPTWCCFHKNAITENTVAIHWNQSSWWETQPINHWKSRLLKTIHLYRFL